MASALVVGDRGSGLTTFVGLLYTAQVRLGTDDADDFRFHANRESIQRLQSIYGALGDGRFPTMDVEWEDHPLSFVFGFRRSALGRLSHPKDDVDPEFDTVRVQVGGLPADEVAELANHDAVLEAPTRRLLSSSVVIPLIDAAALPFDASAFAGLALAHYDHTLAETLGVLHRFVSAEPQRRSRKLFPRIVLTKFDQLNLEMLRKLDAPGGPPSSWNPAGRADFGRRLLDQYFPETRRVLESPHRGTATIEPAVWFFSGLGTEVRDGGEVRIRRRLRPPLGGWEPEYPFEEYRALLEELGRLAHRLPRDKGSLEV